jgi:hypothetical protein
MVAEDPRERATLRFECPELVALTRAPDARDLLDDDDPLPEWDEPSAVRGSQSGLAPSFRTVHDPLTTGLLAEVARSLPSEPDLAELEGIQRARMAAIDDAAVVVLLAGDYDTAPVTHINVRRRS